MTENPSERFGAMYRELGLSEEMIEMMRKSAAPDELSRLDAALAERDQLRREVERYQQREREMAELIGAPNPEKLMHDLRNVLNELTLLRAVVDSE